MKKLLFALPAVLLAVFLSGCGKTPDEELKAKVPESANVLCLFNGTTFVRTKSYKDHQKDILKALKDSPCKEDILQCRILAFGSTKTEWGGALIQSANRQVQKIFGNVLKECKKEKDTVKDLKENSVNKERRVTATVDGKKILAVLYHENLMLIAVQKTDPAFFKAAKPNSLFKTIQMKNIVFSSAMKVEVPQQGKGKECTDMAFQMLPALKKLTAVSLNVPFSETDSEIDFQMIFQDEQAAGETLAALNMGLGFIANSEPDFVKQIHRKTEKNILRVKVFVKPLEEAIRKMQQKQEQKQQNAVPAAPASGNGKPAVPAKAPAQAKPAVPAKAPAQAKPAAPAKAPAQAKPAAPAKAPAQAKPAQ